MKKELTTVWIAALIISVPGLFFLAHFPQSPDGAELVSTALAKGVPHPSGLPLQAWLDQIFILFFPATPALGLSLLSWLCEFGALGFLMLSLRRLGVRPFAVLCSALAFAFYDPMATLALQPEKYSLTALLSMLFIWACAPETLRPRDTLIAAAAFGLMLSEHSGLVLLLPLLAVPLWRNRGPRTLVLSAVLIVVTPTVFYLSLFLLRSQHPWPDWGSIETLSDLWHHVSRGDFKNGLINLDNQPAGPTVSALHFFWRGLMQWPILNIFPAIGVIALCKRRTMLGWALVATIAVSLVAFALADLPMPDNPLTLGYGSRYPCVILPVLAIVLGFGIESAMKAMGRRASWVMQILLVGGIIFCVANGFALMRKVDSNIIEIYRQEVARELPPTAIFVSTNEMDLFYGIPSASGIRFPLKDLFASPWYRERTAPAMDERVSKILPEFNRLAWSYPEFLKVAVEKGYTLASTSGNLFINIPEFRGHIEQLGLVWIVSPETRALYTDSIVQNAQQLCESLKGVNFALPKNGDYFLQELVANFKYVFLSAGDALQRPTHCSAYDALTSEDPR